MSVLYLFQYDSLCHILNICYNKISIYFLYIILNISVL